MGKNLSLSDVDVDGCGCRVCVACVPVCVWHLCVCCVCATNVQQFVSFCRRHSAVIVVVALVRFRFNSFFRFYTV